MSSERHQNDLQARINHCWLAHIYKEKLNEMDPNQVMSIFISSNEKDKRF